MLGKSQLEKVISLLIKLQLLPKSGPASWQVRLSTCYSFLFYLTDVDFLQVKLGANISLLNEYISLQKAHTAFPEYTPYPYGLYEMGTDQVMITRGVCHEPMIRGRKDLTQREHVNLYSFFTRYNLYFQLSIPLSSLLALFEQTTPYIQSVLPEILSVPGIAQHGDLALTNLGNTKTGIVVFDWEDFGSVNVPFYDMTIFICSFYDFKMEVIYDVLNSKNRMQSLVKSTLKDAGIALSTYKRWIPVHLALFAMMKSKLGYSAQVVELSSDASNRAITHLKKWEKACAI